MATDKLHCMALAALGKLNVVDNGSTSDQALVNHRLSYSTLIGRLMRIINYLSSGSLPGAANVSRKIMQRLRRNSISKATTTLMSIYFFLLRLPLKLTSTAIG